MYRHIRVHTGKGGRTANFVCLKRDSVQPAWGKLAGSICVMLVRRNESKSLDMYPYTMPIYQDRMVSLVSGLPFSFKCLHVLFKCCMCMCMWAHAQGIVGRLFLKQLIPYPVTSVPVPPGICRFVLTSHHSLPTYIPSHTMVHGNLTLAGNGKNLLAVP